eukprot:UN22484
MNTPSFLKSGKTQLRGSVAAHNPFTGYPIYIQQNITFRFNPCSSMDSYQNCYEIDTHPFFQNKTY